MSAKYSMNNWLWRIDMKGGNFYGTSIPKKNQPKMPIIETKNRFGLNLTFTRR